MGLTPFDIVHPDHRDIVCARLAAMRTTRQPVPSVELSIVTLDGCSRTVAVVASPLSDGSPDSVLVLMHDLTGRQRTEHLLESVLECVSDAILTIDAEGPFWLARDRGAVRSHARLLGHDVSMLMRSDANRHHSYLVRHRELARFRASAHGLSGCADGSTFPIGSPSRASC
jgi:hypothetical protein